MKYELVEEYDTFIKSIPAGREAQQSTKEEVTEVAEQIVNRVLADNLLEITCHPTIQTAICVSRGIHNIQEENNFRLAIGLARAAFSNMFSRKLLANHFERVIFQTILEPLHSTFLIH